MTKARDIADNAGKAGSGVNVIVNGAMNLSQRGTSFASVGNVYTLDRFEFYKQNSGAAFTVSQSSVTDLAGFGNALKVDCTTADTSLASNEQGYVSHKLEGQDLQRFQKGHATALGFTLSFYVKTNKTGLYTVSMFDRDNTRKVNGSYTVADTNWNRYTINFPADTTGKFDDDNASSLEIFFNLYAGADTNTGTLKTTWAASTDAGSTTGQVNFADSTSNDWEITGIQLEAGQATPFEHEPYETTLRKSERYFQTYSKRNWQGTNEHAANYFMYCDGVFRQKMRAAPTATFVGTVEISRPQVGVSQRPNELTGLSSEGFQGFKWPTSGTYGGQLGTHGDTYYRMSVGDGPTNRLDFDAEL